MLTPPKCRVGVPRSAIHPSAGTQERRRLAASPESPGRPQGQVKWSTTPDHNPQLWCRMGCAAPPQTWPCEHHPPRRRPEPRAPCPAQGGGSPERATLKSDQSKHGQEGRMGLARFPHPASDLLPRNPPSPGPGRVWPLAAAPNPGRPLRPLVKRGERNPHAEAPRRTEHAQ